MKNPEHPGGDPSEDKEFQDRQMDLHQIETGQGFFSGSLHHARNAPRQTPHGRMAMGIELKKKERRRRKKR